jgi:hypothetical protein
VGSVKPTRLRASRSRRTRRSERFSLHAALIWPPGLGHAPTRPLARCSATRCTGSVARPCRTRGPSLYVIGRSTDQSVAFCARHALPRPAALLGFCPFAGFIPQSGWSRGSSTAATLHSDISVRPGPRVVRAGSSASRFIFAGMTGRRLVNTSELKRRSVVRIGGFDFWASTPVCGPPRDQRDREAILPWASPLAGLTGT